MRRFFFSLLLLSLPCTAEETHMVVEAYSGKVLSASGSKTKRPVASLTKMATAIVAIDWATATQVDIAREKVFIPHLPENLSGSSTLGLKPGDQLSLRDALNAALLASDNTAAVAIADHVGRNILAGRQKNGDPVAAFITEMNHLAEAISAKDTRFTNPHGLSLEEKPGFSTAADMARLSIHAMRRNALSFIVRQPSREITVNGQLLTIKNTNELIGEPGILGIKTGTSNTAGSCLATCMDLEPLVRTKADGTKGVTPRRLIVVVLNSPDRFSRTRQLIRGGWAHYDAWLANGAPINNPKREILVTPAPR